VVIPEWAELVAVVGAAGALSVPIAAVLNQWTMPPWLKLTISLIVSVAAGIGGAIILLPDWPASPSEWVLFVVSAITGSQLAYSRWKKIGLDRLELKTSLTKSPGTHAVAK
jgi:hypothetical protein